MHQESWEKAPCVRRKTCIQYHNSIPYDWSTNSNRADAIQANSEDIAIDTSKPQTAHRSMSYVPCHCLPQEASLILVKQQTEQNILNCYIYLNGNENSQNIPLIGEAGVVEVERLQSQQIKIIHGKCMLRCRIIPLIGEAGAPRSQHARQLYLDN